MPGLLGTGRGGLLGRSPKVRQISVPQSSPQPGSGWMAMGQGGPPAYGSDEWATQIGGPGALLWRQLARGLMSSKNPLSVLDPMKAHKFFTDDTIGFLRPEIQAGYKKKAK